MQIAVLGTGEVGRRLASRLVQVGHRVVLGSRTADNAEAHTWAGENHSAHGTFAEAATFGEVVVNATGGLVTAAVLEAAGAANLAGKVVIDVSNALDFSRGFPPDAVTFDGLGVAETIQRDFPQARVVKTLNTMNNKVMVRPDLVPGDHVVFLSGDDADAKAVTAGLLRDMGWRDPQIQDLGGISTSRATEQFVIMWVHMNGVLGGGSGMWNIGVLRGEDTPFV
ncbi:NAD(P)-binding domain-containing protein [Catenulispora yoronensis]|uniref:NAD(P)-binding domain-containing protein n=1 Tax=Catenulispora yoronensis TaxID=450799 RepID=A0ABP5GHS6_9ACTN